MPDGFALFAQLADLVLSPFFLCTSRVGFGWWVWDGWEQAVCKAAGPCKRMKLLARKGQRNPEKSTERLLIPELLSDIVHAVKKTNGCVNFIRIQEELERLGEPMGGAVTRWGYWTLVCKWLAPTTGRFELIVTFLLHKWLQAQGDEGIALASSEDDTPTLSGDALLDKVQTLKDGARLGLLLEMLNPEVRVWLCFLEIYGERSAQRFIKFTENDDAVKSGSERPCPALPAPSPSRLSLDSPPLLLRLAWQGVAFKAGRVIRQKLSYLQALMGDDDSAKDLERNCPWADDFKPLRELVKARAAAFGGVDVQSIVRKAAGAARGFFEKSTEAWRTNPVLVVLGTMDERGGAVTAAKELMGLAKQGVCGIAQVRVRCLPVLPITP